MPKPGPKPKPGSALQKAIKSTKIVPTLAHPPTASPSTILDIRTAAGSPEFKIDDIGITVGKRAPTKTGVKTSLTQESFINVDRRVRNAAVPMGVAVDDVAQVVEDLSVEAFGAALDHPDVRRLMPKRPVWSYELSSGRLHHREVEAYKRWLADVHQAIIDRGGYPPAFEQNLQVWRQLWRVLERSDVAVLVLDVRHPLMHLPPALVYHVARTLKKPLVLLLNKLDTVPAKQASRWAECLRLGIPGVDAVVGFSKEESIRPGDYDGLKVGRAALIEACQVAHAAWAAKQEVPKKEVKGLFDEADAGIRKERIMLGLVGHPNVGKSSLVNSLMGGKFVSVKATPGHTKILQTLILDDRTCLCDCPGVVFPRLEVPREVQIIGMLIPLAQVQEPFSSIRWVMERATVPLHELLHVKPASLRQVEALHEAGTHALKLDLCDIEDEQSLPWSPMLLCALFAQQRGLVHRGRHDTIKAGNEILLRVLEGRVPYAVTPPEPAEVREAVARRQGGHGADEEGSDEEGDAWQLDDEDYHSEDDVVNEAALAGDLFGALGVDRPDVGSGSIKSRKRQDKQKVKREQTAVEKDLDADKLSRKALGLAEGKLGAIAEGAGDAAEAGPQPNPARPPKLSAAEAAAEAEADVGGGYRRPVVTICRNFQSGTCYYGSECRYAHSEAELAPAPPTARQAIEGGFVASPTFQGMRPGMAFKTGAEGTGYYPDLA